VGAVAFGKAGIWRLVIQRRGELLDGLEDEDDKTQRGEELSVVLYIVKRGESVCVCVP